MARNGPLEPARSRKGARNGCSSPLGLAGALEIAARARSALLWRSKWPLEPARLRWGARQRCSGLLGFAGAFKFSARTRSASLGRSKWPLELARLRWGKRNRCSGLLGRPRWGARQRCSSSLGWRDVRKTIRKRCARVATRSEHLALFVYAPSMDMLGSALVYMYMYMYMYTGASD
jgi:hypothetical protein